jgi:hypothetical protein
MMKVIVAFCNFANASKNLYTKYNITIGTEDYSLAQKYVFRLVKPGHMFQLHSHQTYLKSLVDLYMLNAYAIWDPISEAKLFADGAIQWINPLNGSCF